MLAEDSDDGRVFITYLLNLLMASSAPSCSIRTYYGFIEVKGIDAEQLKVGVKSSGDLVLCDT